MGLLNGRERSECGERRAAPTLSPCAMSASAGMYHGTVRIATIPESLSDEARNSAIPRNPVLGWSTFSGAVKSPLPSVDELSQVVYTTSGHAAIALALQVLGCRPGSRSRAHLSLPDDIAGRSAGRGAGVYPLTADGEPSIDWPRNIR